MGPRKNIERINKIRELAAEGMSQSLIADHLGVTRERIRQLCNREGIETVSGLRDWDTIDALKECAEKGMTRREAAEHTGIPVTAVYGYANRYALSFAQRRYMWEEVRDLAAKGMTLTEVAKALNRPTSSIWNTAHEHGITFVKKSRSDRSWNTKKIPVTTDLGTFPSIKAAAEAHGVTSGALHYWVKTGKATRHD